MRIPRTILAASIALTMGITTLPAQAVDQVSVGGKETSISVIGENGRDFREVLPGKMGSFPQRPTRAAQAGTVAYSELVNLWVNNATWQASARRFDFHSTDSTGKAVVDRALFVEPLSPWVGPGERPLIAIAPGTQGTGEMCKPSNSHVDGPSISTNPPNIVAPYESLQVARHLALGAAVVIIDHHHDAITGDQAYVDNIASGQNLLDAATAVREFGISPKAPVATYGYSQGGSASGAAAELAPTYAPDLNIVANVVGAPPSNLFDVMDSVDGGLLSGVLGYSVDGALQKDLELRDHIYAHDFSARGRDLIRRNNQVCIGGSMLVTGYRSTRELTNDGRSLREVIYTYPPLVRELERQKLGKSVPNAPTLLYGGLGDDVIPVQQVRQLRDAWRAQGAQVEYFENDLPLLPGKTALGHLLPGFIDGDYVQYWMWRKLLGV